jgi:hypothetical protein
MAARCQIRPATPADTSPPRRARTDLLQRSVEPGRASAKCCPPPHHRARRADQGLDRRYAIARWAADSGEILNLAVDPEHPRQGVAARLDRRAAGGPGRPESPGGLPGGPGIQPGPARTLYQDRGSRWLACDVPITGTRQRTPWSSDCRSTVLRNRDTPCVSLVDLTTYDSILLGKLR